MTLVSVADAVAAHDGVDPLNEASRLALAAGDEPRIERAVDDVAYAYAVGDGAVEVFVDPAHRRAGHGTRLVRNCLETGETRFWAHGDLPAARALAAATGLRAVRTLLVLRRHGGEAPVEREVPGVRLRTYTDDDAEQLVQVNARAFATHPEQGAMDLADFRRRTAASWFDPAGLFVAERDGHVVGFHWTKIEPDRTGTPIGEVYVVGVDPREHGHGLGTALTARGLRHMAEAGIETVDLYVEGDNDPALAVYRNLGFTEHARDVLYGS